MKSLGQIIAESREDGIRAAKEEKRPLVIEQEDWLDREVLTNMIRRLPNIGDYVPEGWIETKRFFVDSSGFSSTLELCANGCITFDDLLDHIRVGFGYAIVEVGQFQVYIGEFKKGEK